MIGKCKCMKCGKSINLWNDKDDYHEFSLRVSETIFNRVVLCTNCHIDFTNAQSDALIPFNKNYFRGLKYNA